MNGLDRTPAADDGSDLPLSLEESIDRLVVSIVDEERTRHISTAFLPDRNAMIRIEEMLTWLLFPGFFGPRNLTTRTLRTHVASVLTDVSRALLEQVSAALRYERAVESRRELFSRQCEECDARALQIVDAFIAKLADVRGMLVLDVQAAYDGDPAAHHTDETIFCYPGVRAIAVHRLSHELYKLDVPLLPRMLSEIAHFETGIEIHPGARIGKYFFVDHGGGVVIGETSVIGDYCKIYQGVTLGAKSFPKDERGRLKRGVKRHPTLEDHVTVYAGATILGGDTIIGAGSVINGGVFLMRSVPPGHVVQGPKAELGLRSNPEMPPSSYVI
jgi:serine O-acetyltransferase